MSAARLSTLLLAIVATCALITCYAAQAAASTPFLAEPIEVLFKFLIIVAWYSFVAVWCTEAVLAEIRKLPARLAAYVDEQTGNARLDAVRDINRAVANGQRGRLNPVD